MIVDWTGKELRISGLQISAVSALPWHPSPVESVKWGTHGGSGWHPASPWKERAWGLDPVGCSCGRCCSPALWMDPTCFHLPLVNTWRWVPVLLEASPSSSQTIHSFTHLCLTSQPTPLPPRHMVAFSSVGLEVHSYLTLVSISLASFGCFLHDHSVPPSSCISGEG